MSDLYAAAQAVIAERRALIEAGTPGPWRDAEVASTNQQERRVFGGERSVVYDEPTRTILASLHGGFDDFRKKDAALIVVMHAAFGPMLDLAEDVLVVSHPVDVDGYCLGRHMHYEGAVKWPCDRARAALRALGLEA